MDEFFDEYLKEKEGGEEYIMLPEFIKEEDKKKQKEINENKMPLGLIIMSNNNKVLNEVKNFYNTQNFNLNMNMFNGINNNLNRYNSSFNNNNIINKGNINLQQQNSINNLTNNNSNNSIKKENNNTNIDLLNNKSKSHYNFSYNKFNDSRKFEKIENITKVNSFNPNINKTEKNKLIEDNNENNKSKKNNEKYNEIVKEEKEKSKIEKKENKITTQPVEINPFLNPMLISSNTINNLF